MPFFSRFLSLVTVLIAISPAICQQAAKESDYKMMTQAPTRKQMVFLGCYRETTRGKSLNQYSPTTSPQMSPQFCEDYCAKFDSAMYGISRGNSCFCGDALSQDTVPAPVTECNTACIGDGHSFCGATNRVNVYGPETMLTEPDVPSTIVHRGCFQDVAGTVRGLSDYPSYSHAQMTVKMCQDHCSAYQSLLMGVQNGRECYCGNSAAKLTSLPGARCNRACIGGGGFCGGTGRIMNVYELDFSKFSSIGQWGDLIKFPVIPVAVALMPENGNILAWSAGWANRWTFAGNGKTYTAIWDAKTGQVSEAIIQNTKHDMFCPGISMDQEGRFVVNGGSTGAKTSIFDSKTNTWTGGADMAIPRAYQSSTLTSDGMIFAIGGSFQGTGAKNGEVYNPFNNTWNKLPNSPVAPMLMASGRGSFRADSHAWLFAWKEGWVLQAGPSRAMNWYQTRAQGGYKAAGNRGSDPDSMCAVFVMYDALNGKIFTLGGSPTYDGSAATSNAHVITIDEAGGRVTVEKVQNGEYPRGYANGVVLPDGKIFIVGGQTRTLLFSDSNPVLFPEMFDPDTKKFTKLRAHTVPRNYHSTALLMPDATIFSGGGGLCNACSANHFDGQFYSPPYLFEADGKTPAARPAISTLSTNKVKLSSNDLTVTITMAAPADYKFSLIRMSSVTHATNTDQRRIPFSGGQGTQFTINIPRDSGISLPGYWMLFAVNGQGVPSIAETVQIVL